jgi:hypothetical protein
MLLKGLISEVERNSIIVSVPREAGVIHVFRIHEDYIPIPLRDIRIGEEIMIKLSKRNNCEIEIDLNEEEIKNLPPSWLYDIERKRILIPCCLDKESINFQPARKEIIDYLIRFSWLYCFDAEVTEISSLKRVYEVINKGSRVEGKIIEEVRDKENKVTGLKVFVEVDIGTDKKILKGFLPFGECSWHKINSPLDVVSIREIVSLRVIKLKPLILSKKKAFSATALITEVGFLIGKKGEKINKIIEGLDVLIDPDRDPGKVIVEAASRIDRDTVCERISSQVKGVGIWEKD